MRSHIAKHKHYIVQAVALSLACAIALVTGNGLGLGGIQVTAPCLLVGVFVIEFGRTVAFFGAKGNEFYEHAGVGVQGLGIWITVINPMYLGRLRGAAFAEHLLAPALLLVVLPVVVHFATKCLLQRIGWMPEGAGELGPMPVGEDVCDSGAGAVE